MKIARKGYYFVGFFDKGKKAMNILTTEKPFEINSVDGTIEGKCLSIWEEGKPPKNRWPKKWLFIKGTYQTMDKEVMADIEDTWKSWCKEFNRNYTVVFDNGKN